MEASSVTAARLVNTKGKISAVAHIFFQCMHFSDDCFKAQQITVFAKRQLIGKNQCCFICLRSANCKKVIKQVKTEPPRKIVVDNEEKTLANHSSPDTLLETLIITIKGKRGEQQIRIPIDLGSWHS
ncbi:hypothetical protein PR048_023271 [Dryococelus australis]|uniref:Uncharacterized protein n=1 Tax=Dryococelus australis TaxID=614101 RepID=A0ABQ9GTP0_9NEOP|nr:hypothetical protein PR048_023271 [Dryococelus australis]